MHSQQVEMRKRRHRSVARVREWSAKASARIAVYGILSRGRQPAHSRALAYPVTMVYTCGMTADDAVATHAALLHPGTEPWRC
jgi:hypothetical protein